VGVLTDLSVQPNTGKYTLARFFSKDIRNKIEREKQTDEHHARRRRRRNTVLISNERKQKIVKE